MNGEIASACAWRPDDTAVRLGQLADAEAREDRILATFEARLAELRHQFAYDRFPDAQDLALGRVARAKGRHRMRRQLMNAAICRVAAQLAGAEIDIHPNARRAS